MWNKIKVPAACLLVFLWVGSGVAASIGLKIGQSAEVITFGLTVLYLIVYFLLYDDDEDLYARY